MSKPTDIHAFPKPAFTFPNGDVEYSEFGMTLRDHFAGESLLPAYYMECSSPRYGGTPGKPLYQGIAERAYLMADAMLRAREGK